ncbi:MAG: cell division protein ZipA [Coxiellaceae bacterium]|nr:cell division protein ZipA [Coxiellaceae bacterium]
MLVTILCLIGLVVVGMIAARIMSPQDKSSNSYKHKRRRKSKQEPHLGRVAPTFSDTNSNDPDEILGLKPAHDCSAESQVSAVSKPRIISIHLVAAADREYVGYELLQAILATGLRYGDMQIFHRHQERNGSGPVLFSMSSISEPGTFDLPNIGGFSCRGVSFFMRYDNISDPQQAFHAMIEAAMMMQEDLGGHVLASDRQPLDQAVIEHYEQQINEFVKQHTDEARVSSRD